MTFGTGVFHNPLEARSGAFAEIKLKFVVKLVKTPSVFFFGGWGGMGEGGAGGRREV